MVIFLRLLFTVILLYIALVCVTATIGIWKTPYDSKLTLRAMWQPVKRALTKPTSILNVLQSKGHLGVAFIRKGSSVTITPEGPTVIKGADLKGTSNYQVKIENNNSFPIFDVLLTGQVPGAIRKRTVIQKQMLQGFELEPLGGTWDLTITGDSGISFSDSPRPYRTQIKVARMEPNGFFDMALLLDSVGNKLIPPYIESQAKDAVLFFIRITYKRQIGSETIDQVQFHKINDTNVDSLTIEDAEYKVPKYVNFVGWEF